MELLRIFAGFSVLKLLYVVLCAIICSAWPRYTVWPAPAKPPKERPGNRRPAHTPRGAGRPRLCALFLDTHLLRLKEF